MTVGRCFVGVFRVLECKIVSLEHFYIRRFPLFVMWVSGSPNQWILGVCVLKHVYSNLMIKSLLISELPSCNFIFCSRPKVVFSVTVTFFLVYLLGSYFIGKKLTVTLTFYRVFTMLILIC